MAVNDRFVPPNMTYNATEDKLEPDGSAVAFFFPSRLVDSSGTVIFEINTTTGMITVDTRDQATKDEWFDTYGIPK